MNDNLNNNEKFDFRKEFENQKKELAHAQKFSKSFNGAELPADSGNSYQRKQFKIKFVHIILLGVVAVVGVYFYNYYMVNKEHKYEGHANIEILYNKDNLIRFLKDDRYGYIDSEGNIIIDAKYIEASNFYNGYALVNDGNKKYIINVNNQEIVDVGNNSEGYNVKFDYWLLNDTLYSGQMLKLFDDVKKVGNSDKYFYYYDKDYDRTKIVDYDGNPIYEVTGKNIKFEVKSGSYTEDYIYMLYDNKYYILNPVSKLIIYESSNVINSYKDGIFKQDRYYYIYDDETLYPFVAKNLTLVDKEKKILKVEVSNDNIYYFDTINNIELENYVESNLNIVDSQSGYDIVYCDEENHLYSMVSGDNVILDCKYDKIEFLNDELEEYIRNKNGFEYVFVQNVELSIIYNIRLKMNSVEEDYVNRDYKDGSPFVVYSPQDDNKETQILVYNFFDNSKRKYPKTDYTYFDSGYNYYVLYNIKTEKLEYYSLSMKNIFSIDYDKRIGKLENNDVTENSDVTENNDVENNKILN